MSLVGRSGPLATNPVIVGSVVRSTITRAATGDGLREALLSPIWRIIKSYGATEIPVVALGDLCDAGEGRITGYVDDPNRAALAATAVSQEVRTIFEIGTYTGKTTYTLAASCPEATITTLDLPSPEARRDLALDFTDEYLFEQWNRGKYFTGTPEEKRITAVTGDSARFDFSPYDASCDLVYIDGSHSYTYVSNDTVRALRLLKPGGIIAWDDYPHYPGVYALLRHFARRSPGFICHIEGTRLVLYSTRDLRRSRGRDADPSSPSTSEAPPPRGL